MNIDNLNKKQREAVEKIGGPILVFAGAGSGKTRVLTHKIAYLIEEVGLPPKNILAVTFTNKAAQEMKSRVLKLVNRDISGISVGTFHSISAQLLRKNIQKIGYDNNFTIYDQQDSRSVVRGIIKEMNLDLKQYDPKSFQGRISSAKNSMLEPNYFKNSAENFIDEKFHAIYENYQNILKKNNSVDFDDLLILPLKIFSQHPECLNFYQNRFQYVLVDEYQDTNKPQFEFVYSLASKHKDIFVVGDDDQSIYGWRGADISNILNFKDAFGTASIIKLEQNYRSTKNILDAAWSVVSKNEDRAEKKLWTNNEKGDLLTLIENENERHEAKQILRKIIEKKDCLKEICVLYRTNSQSRTIEDELRKATIPYHIIGGVKFYDRKEIKDILAYMKILVNKYDSISFDRIVNFPVRGIGAVALKKIHEYSNDKNISYFDSLENLSDINLSKKQFMELTNFSNMINIYMDRMIKEKPSIILSDLLKEINLKKYYENLGTPEASDRWDNIEELVSSIKEFEENRDDPTLVSYLEDVSLLTDIDKWNDSENRVTLMTVHSSKGLEFDNVNIIGLEDGLFPLIRNYTDDDIEEERRLFYVGITRARKKVNLSYAKFRRRFGSNPSLTIKSRFLDEISDSLISSSIKNRNYISSSSFNKNEIIDDVIKKGTIVEHSIFGKGTILNIEGIGSNRKLTILFINNVTKKLIFKYANLKIIK